MLADPLSCRRGCRRDVDEAGAGCVVMALLWGG